MEGPSFTSAFNSALQMLGLSFASALSLSLDPVWDGRPACLFCWTIDGRDARPTLRGTRIRGGGAINWTVGEVRPVP
jgi:hypothetical protein